MTLSYNIATPKKAPKAACNSLSYCYLPPPICILNYTCSAWHYKHLAFIQNICRKAYTVFLQIFFFFIHHIIRGHGRQNRTDVTPESFVYSPESSVSLSEVSVSLSESSVSLSESFVSLSESFVSISGSSVSLSESSVSLSESSVSLSESFVSLSESYGGAYENYINKFLIKHIINSNKLS